MKFLRTTAKHLRLVEKSNLSSSSNAHPFVNNSTYHEVYVSMFRYILDPVQTQDTQANIHTNKD